MIRCMLFLDPGGVSRIDEWELLGHIDISNSIDRSLDDPRRGDYEYEIFKKRRTKPFAQGVISNFPRLSYHPWNLVKRILDEVARDHGGTI